MSWWEYQSVYFRKCKGYRTLNVIFPGISMSKRWTLRCKATRSPMYETPYLIHLSHDIHHEIYLRESILSQYYRRFHHRYLSREWILKVISVFYIFRKNPTNLPAAKHRLLSQHWRASWLIRSRISQCHISAQQSTQYSLHSWGSAHGHRENWNIPVWGNK